MTVFFPVTLQIKILCRSYLQEMNNIFLSAGGKWMTLKTEVTRASRSCHGLKQGQASPWPLCTAAIPSSQPNCCNTKHLCQCPAWHSLLCSAPWKALTLYRYDSNIKYNIKFHLLLHQSSFTGKTMSGFAPRMSTAQIPPRQYPRSFSHTKGQK